jgi:hypothetical protein
VSTDPPALDDDVGLSRGTKIGYAVTAVWMLGVLVYTDGDVRHPVFDLIFIVPLGAWVVGLTAARLIRRMRG